MPEGAFVSIRHARIFSRKFVLGCTEPPSKMWGLPGIWHLFLCRSRKSAFCRRPGLCGEAPVGDFHGA